MKGGCHTGWKLQPGVSWARQLKTVLTNNGGPRCSHHQLMGIDLTGEKACGRDVKTVSAVMVLTGSEQVFETPEMGRPAIQRLWHLANNPIGRS